MSNQKGEVIQYGNFEIPSSCKVDGDTASDSFARFIVGPFERGFGHTVGNSLRRILLSSLESPAIISIRMEGVPHEYMAIEGIIEDMTDIILNLKGALLRRLTAAGDASAREPWIITNVFEVTDEDLHRNGGKQTITLGDLAKGSPFEVVNPDLPLFTVTQPMRKQVDLKVTIGRGYVPSERHELQNKVVDEIVIDSCFSPVRLVNYWVENTRVGQDTDYDRLILEISTDGRITPEESLAFASQIGIKHLEVFEELESVSLTFDQPELDLDADSDEIMDKLCLRIDEIELSVRSTNCLSGANIRTIAELVTIPERRMLEFRNFGKKSLNEIKAKLTDMGLSLGMDLSRYGITEDNVSEKVETYLKEKKEATKDFVPRID